MKLLFVVFMLLIASASGQAAPAKNAPTKNTTPIRKTKPAANTDNKKIVQKKEKGTTTAIEFDEGEKQTETSSDNTSVERILRNPVLAGGLSNGADAINRSINSLMSSLFYRLMDNEFRHPLTGSANILLGFNRDVYTAENGAWVVVDRFGIGPEYGKELYRYNDIPVKIGASQKSEIFDIYLRTDPMRVSDNKKLPAWRVAVNNWFGVLPILESILPPSFNANEMYDPMRRLEAPFTFPLSMESFEGMETGSIKSYSISGGINLGIEMAEGIHGFKDIVTSGSSALEISLPYTVFRTGEYRVNVLKRDLTTAWVGITDTNRTGHRIESHIGKTYYLLSKTIPLWTGMPAQVFPVDFNYEEAMADLFGRVYSFDLRNEEARRSYLEAVHGNLAPAQLSWLRSREDNIKTGVGFFYNKKEKRFQTSITAGQNVFVVNKGTRRTHSDAEIEITDRDGKFYILEARQDRDHETWDMLTGSSSANYSAIADLRVRKVIEGDGHGGIANARYEFIADPNPIDVALSLQIIDKFVETEDFYDYMKHLGRFTQIDLEEEVPNIPIRDYTLESRRRRRIAFDNDASPPMHLHVTPTHLGSFEGYASARLTTQDMLRIAQLPREKLWASFCQAFEVKKSTCQTVQKSLSSRNLDRLAGWLVLPVKILDIRLPRFDAMDEIEDSIRALKAFAADATPEGKRDQLRKLFSTDYPLQVAQALLMLSDLQTVPRSVQIGAKPKGNGPDSAKSLFGQMDGRRFRGGPRFPPPARYDSTLAIENNFNPANLSFTGIKPRIRKLSLFKEEVTTKNVSKSAIGDNPIPPLSIRLYGTRLEESQNVHVYVRLEQTGKVQLAKFKLTEDVIDIPAASATVDLNLGSQNFLIRISGPQSSIANLVSSEALALGGSFRLTVALSANGIVWSDERYLDFRIEDGKLLPAN